MRTTLDLPDELVNEAMTMTRSKTKTDLIKTALKNIIQKEKSKSIQQYFGKVDLDIDLNAMRKR